MAKKIPARKPEDVFAAKCKTTLDAYWAEVRQRVEAGNIQDYVTNPAVVGAIRDSLADSTDKTHHYALITQLVSKVTHPKVNARSLQERAEVEGSFDPRTVCKKTIVPFGRTELDGTLGRSPDPYVNNPVRVPLLTKSDRESKSDPQLWDKLCDVVDAVEKAQDEEFTKSIFRQVLLEIYRKLGGTEIKYDVPLRASLEQVVAAIGSFMGIQSGGDRPLVVTAALFQVVGKYFKLFEPEVKRKKITATDEASGQVADIECVDGEGRIVIAAEVKDRTVTVSDLEEKLPSTRKNGVKEFFFLSAKSKKQGEDVPERVAREFAAGQNLYVFDLIELAASVLAVAGEASRRDFLTFVGDQLDEFSYTKHRLAWKATLREMSTG